jgi:EAL domain-containing protein (putative c-di-GMP-specific phosphodiesterase class I)
MPNMLNAQAQTRRMSKPMTTPARVLLVDDDDFVRRSYGRVLGAAGMLVLEAPDAETAMQIVEEGGLDVVVSDVGLPHMDGLTFLTAVQRIDPDLPVLIMTGAPTVHAAVHALEHGAIRFLTKPVGNDELRDTIHLAARRYRQATAARAVNEKLGCALLRTNAELDAALDRALAGLKMVFQPLVVAATRRRHGYEALVRSSEPSLPNPAALFAAAERLGRLQDLGRAIRRWVAGVIDQAGPEDHIFVNLHPTDLEDDDLFGADAPLSRHAHRVVLELTERVALEEVSAVAERVSALRDMGYRIAVDDLGAGYAGLSSLVQLAPEVVKLDMSLVRGVAAHPIKRRLIESVVGVCHDIRCRVVAEGVETEDDRDTVLALGCDLLQGWKHGRPAWPFPDHVW